MIVACRFVVSNVDLLRLYRNAVDLLKNIVKCEWKCLNKNFNLFHRSGPVRYICHSFHVSSSIFCIFVMCLLGEDWIESREYLLNNIAVNL